MLGLPQFTKGILITMVIQTKHGQSTHRRISFHVPFFYTPWKQEKITVFKMFLGGIERDQWHEKGYKHPKTMS